MAVENQEETPNSEEQVTETETETLETPKEIQEETVETSETETEDESVTITIGEDSPPEEETKEAPEWVKDLRKANRELSKKNRDLEKKLNTNATETNPVTLGEKPTLEDCDYDSEQYETKLAKWFEDKREYEKQEAEVKTKKEAEANAWNFKLENYGEAKNNLKVKDFDDAEAVVLETLSETQQGIILQGSNDPALLVYALGKNPGRARELSEIKDPITFAFMAGKLEKDLKVSKGKRPTTQPEATVTGTANSSGTVDSTLEKLRADAQKTGNFSKVVAYKKKTKKVS